MVFILELLGRQVITGIVEYYVYFDYTQNGSLAQLVEHSAHDRTVSGSKPGGSTIKTASKIWLENLGDDYMNKTQKWNRIVNGHDGFLIDIKFDFDKLSKYGFEVNETCATFEAHQGHTHEHTLIYKDIRRPRWIYMPSLREKRLISIVRRMYEDGILKPMEWYDYNSWREDNCNEHNILNKR